MNKVVKNITIEVLTGLHIGAGNDTVEIGGVDSAVIKIKDSTTSKPYIPGSSLKGKIRCLLETEGDYNELDDTINMYFGPNSEYLKTKNEDEEFMKTPTRLIFQDLFLSDEDEEKFNAGELNTEYKTEIKINRQTGSTESGALRSIERVPRGVIFEGKLLIRYIDKTELKSIAKVLHEGIELLNTDYLGGSGSRGYGAVSVKIS